MEYIVNTEAQAKGEHEVHKLNQCNHLPAPQNRKSLGFHLFCSLALKEAKKYYINVDGCKHCCPECHTR